MNRLVQRWLKSDFQKFHLVLMVLAIINIVLGLALVYYFIPYPTASRLHMYSGIALVASLVLPMFFPNGKAVYKALRARTYISRRDLEQKKPFVLLAKATATLLALGFAVLFITFVLIQAGIGDRGQLFTFHRGFLWFMVVVAVLHPVFMLLSQRKPKKATPAA